MELSENENDFPDFFEDFDNWSKLKDTDADKLPDCVEQYIGSDSALADTDGDALDDFYELFVTYTEPAKNDTDDNGILDCDEDFDKDDLSNLEEYLASTLPWDDDTDSDILKDGEEIDTYSTDPLKPDTDDDGLEDSDEIHLGTDPVNPDTDSDGILDGDEKFYQTYTHIVENEDCVVSEVIVSLEGTGNLQKNTTVKSVMNKDVLCTNVAGLVGEPFNIETSSQFDTATITFKIDKSKLGDTEFDNLMFLWYDEENDEFVELETILDEQNSTVSVVTTHFSNYMLVDSKVWFDMWSVDFNYRPSGNDGLNVTYDTVIAIDCSGSMASYDVTGINSKRAQAVINFIETMGFGDRAGIVMFTSVATVACGLTDSQEALEDGLSDIASSGGTDFNAAIKAAITLFDENDTLPITKRIILLSDGIDTVSYDVLDKCKERNIAVYTIRLGSASDSTLNTIAEYTGGKFFKAYTTDELLGIYADIGMSGEFDATDTDGDGLYDIFETTGMRMQNGYLGVDYEAVTTDKYNPDTDGDGLLDGEEIDPAIKWSEKRYYSAEIGEFVVDREYFFTMYSDPNNPDTDGDGLLDQNDPVKTSEIHHDEILLELSRTRLDSLMEAYESVDNTNEFVFADEQLQGTREKVILLQKCLEYLGYLDMENKPYGSFGGLTVAATMLYQINHCMYYEDSIDMYGIDKVTYYSIILSAVNAGCDINCAEVLSAENYFVRLYIPICSIPEEYPLISIVESERSSERETIYTYDLTTVLNGVLRYGAQDFHFHYYDCNKVPSYVESFSYDTVSYDNWSRYCLRTTGDYFWMIKQVKNEAKYDVKRENSWNNLSTLVNAYIPYFHSAFPFVYDDKEINAEIFGNLLFGYICNAGGFSLSTITTGGSIYSVLTEGEPDNKEDSDSIRWGYELYNDVKNDYHYLHITEE